MCRAVPCGPRCELPAARLFAVAGAGQCPMAACGSRSESTMPLAYFTNMAVSPDLEATIFEEGDVRSIPLCKTGSTRERRLPVYRDPIRLPIPSGGQTSVAQCECHQRTRPLPALQRASVCPGCAPGSGPIEPVGVLETADRGERQLALPTTPVKPA